MDRQSGRAARGTSRLVVAERPRPGEDAVALATLAGEARHGTIFRRLRRYAAAELTVETHDSWRRPLFALAVLRLASRGPCVVRDRAGCARSVGWATLAAAFGRMARDAAACFPLRRRYARAVAALSRPPATPPGRDGAGAPVMLRTALAPPSDWGGAASHARGVLAGLAALGPPPVLLSPSPLAAPPAVTHLALPRSGRFADFPGLAPLAASCDAVAAACQALSGRRVGFVYHRNIAFDIAGAGLARALGVPLVLEYNGAEGWMARHWGGGRLAHAALADRAEAANLAAADVVAVVSRALAEELAGRGVAADKIVVAPNGVDAARFSPAIDGAAVRARLGLSGTVVGFSGSFGRWHGAELLAAAFARLAPRRTDATLLMIGDGETRAAAERLLAEAALSGRARFTGAVAPDDMPAHLAACDVLVSPQLPNPDGTPFFGSPTKLVEYMAMGRAVVASRLGQMTETVADGETGLLVTPADPAALAAALDRLAADAALRARLGAAARAEAERRSWRGHVERILAKLDERVPCR